MNHFSLRTEEICRVTIALGVHRQRVETRLMYLPLLTCRGRLVRLLLELAENRWNDEGEPVEIRIPLSLHDLASLSRETTPPALVELQSAGLVEVSRRRIGVQDDCSLSREYLHHSSRHFSSLAALRMASAPDRSL